MKNYITFEENDLNSTITTLGFNLHKISEQIIYFKQFAKIKGVEHDAVTDIAFEYINESLSKLRYEFNLPKEPNICLEQLSQRAIDEIIERVNKDHDNPYRATIPKLQELVRSFLAIAEREGKDTNWDGFKTQCKMML